MESSALHHVESPHPPSLRGNAIDLGLRHADRAFRERVVPGVARVWFTRQLSWSCAALLLYQQINNRSTTVPSPSRIAHGLEALSTKAALFCRDASTRHLGTAVLEPRLPSAHCTDWAFAHLASPEGYVTNTHRSAAAPALRSDGGLGLARGTRFDLMLLEPAGRALAQAFLSQPVSDTDTLGTALTRWVHGDDILAYAPMTLHATLSAHNPTDGERQVVEAALLQGGDAATHKRRILAACLAPHNEFPDVEGVVVPTLQAAGYTQQGDEILAARAFGVVQNSTYAVLSAVTAAMVQDGSVTFTKAVALPAVAEALEEVSMGAAIFKQLVAAARVEEPSATYFAESVLRAPGAEATLRVLLQRAPQLLNISRTKATQGAQFCVLTPEVLTAGDGVDGAEPDRGTYRLANFHSLLRDLAPMVA